MFCKWKAVSAAALLALVAAVPASATVTLHFVQQNTVIPTVGGTANVEIRADFTDAISGWGLDLNVSNPGVADLLSFTIGPDWDPATDTLDDDLLAGLSESLTGVAAGSNILLATLTFQANGIGSTPISLSVNNEDEGFVLADTIQLDATNFAAGSIIVPEPASLALVALGGLALLRRR